MRSKEILSPAGDKKMLMAAIKNGADSIYFGVKEFNMRASAKNFNLDKIKEVVEICHKNKVKAYLTLNTIIYEEELEKLEKILKKVKIAKADAVIAWDFSVLDLAKKLEIPVHISTQASISSSKSFLSFVEKFNPECVVLARECTLDQIKKISKLRDEKAPNVKIECFVHGAMCVSISGRCFLSEFIVGKSANRGECSQICRREFLLKDAEGKGEDILLEPHFAISPKDLCTIRFFDEIVRSGINVFKIEGRGRNPEYVATVTRVYKKALNKILDENYKRKDKEESEKELKKVYNRGFSKGFFMGKPINEWVQEYGNVSKFRKEFIGKVIKFYPKILVAEIKISTGNLKVGDEVFIQGEKIGSVKTRVVSMQIEKKNIKVAKKGEQVGILFETKERIHKNDEIYLIRKND